MKRRDVLKLAPAPILGAAGAAGLFGPGGRILFSRPRGPRAVRPGFRGRRGLGR